MGGVARLDSLLGCFLTKIRSEKYYLRIFFQLTDMTVVTAWLLWREQDSNTPFMKFKLAYADLLCYFQKTPNRDRDQPSIDNGSNRMRPKIQMPYRNFCADKIGQ